MTLPRPQSGHSENLAVITGDQINEFVEIIKEMTGLSIRSQHKSGRNKEVVVRRGPSVHHYSRTEVMLQLSVGNRSVRETLGVYCTTEHTGVFNNFPIGETKGRKKKTSDLFTSTTNA